MSSVPSLPPRPSLPLTLWALITSLAMGRLMALMSFSASARIVRTAAWTLLGGAAVLMIACVVVVLVRLHNRRAARRMAVSSHEGDAPATYAVRVLACAAIVTLLSGGCSCFVYGRQLVAADALSRTAVSGWSLEVISDATPGAYGYRSRAQVIWRRTGHVLGKVWLSSKEPLVVGEKVRCVGRYRRLSEDDYGRSSWSQGLCGSILVVRVLERSPANGPHGLLLRLRDAAVCHLSRAGGDEGALLVGCICGSRTALAERGLDDVFARCGCAHLISVSGAHLAIVTALLVRGLVALRLRPAKRMIVVALVSLLYVAFCGAPTSAVRAWAMSMVAFGSQVAGRRSYGVSSVCIVALLMALHDPTVGANMGFQLSVASVLGLGLFSSYASYVAATTVPAPKLTYRIPSRVRRRAHSVFDGAREVLCATLVCQTVTMPITAGAFGTVSLVAPVANLLVAPLFLPVIALGGASCLMAPIGIIGNPLLMLAAHVARLLVMFLQALSRFPYASMALVMIPVNVPLLCVALEVTLLILWPRVSRLMVMRSLAATLTVVMLVLASWRYAAPARIVVLDIGQGDAILVQDGPHAVLVDAGPDDSVVDALARRHVLHLDAIVITHLHDDHYGGIEYIAGVVPCSSVLVARGVEGAMSDHIREMCLAASGGSELEELGYGDVLHVGCFSLRMIWPTSAVDGDENSESIELLASYERHGNRLSALLTGDAERDETGACIAQGDIGDIDMLKVGHHGSDVSITLDEARVLLPEVSVASAGEGNSYGHPTPTCVETLDSAGSWVLCTKDVGDVEVRPGRDGPVVYTHPRAERGQESPDGL